MLVGGKGQRHLAENQSYQLGGKIGDTGLNEILLNSMQNGCSKQKYLHGFYCETITILKAVNMFERMEIS